MFCLNLTHVYFNRKRKKMIKISRWLCGKGIVLFMITAMALVACGGGDDGGDDPVENNANIDGIWTGSYDSSTDVRFFMNDGEIVGVDENNAPYTGSYTFSATDDNFTANVKNGTAEFELVGSASERSQITATYTSSNGNTGDLTLSFDSSDYDKSSSFESLSGEYASNQSNYSIDNYGGLTGTFLGACQISGTFSILDSEHNLYGLDLDLSGCDYEGQYSGLATIVGDDTYHLMSILSGPVNMVISAYRQ